MNSSLLSILVGLEVIIHEMINKRYRERHISLFNTLLNTLLNTLSTYRKYIVNIVNTLSKKNMKTIEVNWHIVKYIVKHYQSPLHMLSIFILGSKKNWWKLVNYFQKSNDRQFPFLVTCLHQPIKLHNVFPNLDTPNLIFENNLPWSWISRFRFHKKYKFT